MTSFVQAIYENSNHLSHGSCNHIIYKIVPALEKGNRKKDYVVAGCQKIKIKHSEEVKNSVTVARNGYIPI